MTLHLYIQGNGNVTMTIKFPSMAAQEAVNWSTLNVAGEENVINLMHSHFSTIICMIWHKLICDDATLSYSTSHLCIFYILYISYSTRQIWGIWKLRPAYSPETPNLGQNRWCFVPCDLEIWWMTLENNRAPLLCCLELCATFHSHRWIQTGVAVRKRPIWVKFDDF